MSELDDRTPGAAGVDRVHGPLVAFTEEGARRHLEHARRFPRHDADLDAIGVAERRADFRIDEVEDDVHALFFDAERGDLCETGGLDPAHARLDRLLAAPLLDDRA